MNIDHSLSRRTLLKLAVIHAVGASLPLALRSGQLRAAEINNDELAQMVNGLYPHDGFPDSVYERVTAAIAEGLVSSENGEMVEQGLTALQESIPDSNWEQLSQDRREELLGALESQPFFAYVKNQVIHFLYSDSEVWELIGYGGSSIEHGGYINRGFNDIDWLPEAG